LGIGEAGYGPASLSLLGDFFPRATRGRVLSFWSIGTLLGAAIGVAMGARIADTLGWRWAFYIVGIPGLIAAFLAWRMIEPKRGAFDNEVEDIDENDSVQEHGKIGKNFWEIARKLFQIPTYWVLIGALIFSFRSEEHTSELQSLAYLHSFPTRRSSDLYSRLDRCLSSLADDRAQTRCL